ncbi:MAG: ABC transporter permease [Bacteroidia bacterium]
MLVKIAFRNLWRNRARTFITATVIAIAVLISIFSRSLNEGMYGSMIDNVVGTYTGYVQVHQNGYWDDQSMDNAFVPDKEMVNVVTEDPAIVAHAPRIEGFGLASYGNISKGAAVIGIDPELENNLTGLKNQLKQGRFIKKGESAIMLSTGLAKRLKIQLGDTVVLLGQGYHGISAAGVYPVVGLLKFGSTQLNDRMSYLPLEAAQEFFGAPEMLTAMALNLELGQDAEAVATRLQSKVDTAAYEVMGWGKLIPELKQQIDGDRAGGIIFMVILYLIISFIIFGTVLMMVAERSYEFGVINAVGMSRWKMARMLIIELFMLTVLGILLGYLISYPLMSYFSHNPIYMGDELAEAYAEFGMEAYLPAVVDPAIFLNQAIAVGIFVAIISIYPIYKMRKLKPVSAMRGR